MHSDDVRVPTARGELFSRRWRPADAVPGAAPVLLFHDSLGAVALWRDFPAQLAAALGRDVIAYDRLGFGASDPYPAAQIGADFIAEEARYSLAALQRAHGFADFIAFGHSVGGAMASHCAAAAPAQCLALITESSQAFVEDLTLAGIRAAAEQFAQPGQLERLARYHGDRAAWVLAAWIDSWLAESMADWTIEPVLAQVRCPLLALHGSHDEFGSPAHPARYAGGVSGHSRQHLLADCGHVPHREYPDTVIALVRDFLAEALAPATDAG